VQIDGYATGLGAYADHMARVVAYYVAARNPRRYGEPLALRIGFRDR
jgi:hypothetical protein